MHQLEPPALDHPAAPQGLVGVEQRALAPVLHRHQGEPQRARLARLPPVELLDALDALVVEPALETERHEEVRAARRHRCQALDGGEVEVVVMVVRDEHQVDWRQLGDVDRQRHDALRPGERHRGRALGKLRVHEDVLPGELDQESRVPDPGDRRPRVVCGERRRIGLHVRYLPATGRRLGHSLAQLLPLPDPEARLRIVGVVVVEPIGRMVRRLRLREESGERPAGGAEQEGGEAR